MPRGDNAATAARCPPADVPQIADVIPASSDKPARVRAQPANRGLHVLDVAGNVTDGVSRYSIDAIAKPSCAKKRLKSGPVVRVPPLQPPP